MSLARLRLQPANLAGSMDGAGSHFLVFSVPLLNRDMRSGSSSRTSLRERHKWCRRGQAFWCWHNQKCLRALSPNFSKELIPVAVGDLRDVWESSEIMPNARRSLWEITSNCHRRLAGRVRSNWWKCSHLRWSSQTVQVNIIYIYISCSIYIRVCIHTYIYIEIYIHIYIYIYISAT